MTRLALALAIGILSVLTGSPAAWAQAHKPLQYWGGPVLGTFKIYPLYYGNWQNPDGKNNADLTAKQNFLVGLAGYLSGQDAPPNRQPMLKQYGVNAATVAPAITAGRDATPIPLTRAAIHDIIVANQKNGNLPYSSTTLIMVFPAHGFSVVATGGCGYHVSESSSAFWAVVPLDCDGGGDTW